MYAVILNLLRRRSKTNNALYLAACIPEDFLVLRALSLCERKQNPVPRHLSGLCRPLCDSLHNKPVQKAAPGASWLPYHRQRPRAKITAVAKVYRVAEAVRLVLLGLSLSITHGILTPSGNVIYLNAAGQPMVILNSQKVAADLLDRRAGIYSDRPRNIVASDIMTGGLLVVFTRYNDMYVYLI